jgi:outer membrane biosynthesis protein TonB
MMKAILILCLLLIMPGNGFCQSNTVQDSASITTIKKFVETHVHYPAMARENHISGTVFLYFDINNDRTVSNIEIIKGLNTAALMRP